jgi:hypothetical protein
MYWTFLDPKSKLKVNMSKHVFHVFFVIEKGNIVFLKNPKKHPVCLRTLNSALFFKK